MTSINLIPADLRFGRARGRRLRLWGGSTVVAVVLVGIPCVFDQVRAAQAESLRTELLRLSVEESVGRDQLAETEREASHLASQTERAKALRSKRAWSKMLSLLGACLPADAWYTSISTDPASPAGGRGRRRAASPAAKSSADAAELKTIMIDAPRRLELKGFALESEQVWELLKNLKSADVFTQIELVHSSLDSNRDVPAVRFELACDW